MIDLSICFGTVDRLPMLRGCIDSCRAAVGGMSHEFCITDGGSRDGSVEYLRRQHDVILVEHGERRGAIRAYTDAIERASGEYLCYLSDDLIVPPGMFTAAVDYLKGHPACGVVSLPYINPGQRVQKIVYATVGDRRYPFASYGVLRRADGEAAGWFPPITYHYYLDVGLCLNVQLLGLNIDVLPGDWRIQHLAAPNATRGGPPDANLSVKRDERAFNEYWSDRLG